MGKQAKDGFRLGRISTGSLEGGAEETLVATPPQEEELITKVTISVNYQLLDLIRRHARAKGMSQGDAVVSALATFFEEHEPPERPKEVIEREKLKMQQDKRRRLKQGVKTSL